MTLKFINTLFGKILKEFIVVLLVWIVITSLLVSAGQGHPLLILFWVSLFPFGYFFYLINLYWLIPAFEKKQKKVAAYIIELIASAIILSFPFLVIGASSGIQPLKVLIPLFMVVMIASLFITWFIYLRNKEQIQQMLYLKRELGNTASNLQAFRSQINPHFLFNALNTLYGISIQENAVKTGDGIQRLGDMMRFMLQDNQKDMIPLGNEISYLKDYIYLQQLRLAKSENIQLKVNINEPYNEYYIVPMLLVPFVENAFKHGISLQKPSWIDIQLYYNDSCLYFEIKNSLQEKNSVDTEKRNTGIGLENVKERLKLLYPNKHELTISQNENEFIVHLMLVLKS